jgi:hypothetical protein
MLFNFKFFRLFCSFCLFFFISFTAFADTIRLKDGSIIKGKIVNFTSGKFTVAIGEGSRQRQMSFSADDIESIQFDTPQAAAGNLRISDQNTDKTSNETVSAADNRIITIGQNGKTTTPPVAAPEVTEKVIPTQSNPVQTSTPAATQNQTANSTAAVLKPIELNVKVLADNTSNGWTNSGFVVKKGQKIRISADGRVSLGSGRFTTPSGIATLPDENTLMKNVPTGALIVVIGDDNNDFIYVGAEREFVAARDGSLFLGVNEGNLNDNSGVFDVKIEINMN